MAASGFELGKRLRAAREKQGRSQVAVAGLCGITVDYLSQIERGLKLPSLTVLSSLAREVGTPLSVLLGEPDQAAPSGSGSATSVVEGLLGIGPAAVSGGDPLTSVVLRDRVEQAWRMWQTSPQRFTVAAAVLPTLIAEVECARRASATATPDERREVLRCAADLYGLLRSYCRRTGRSDLSVMVADRALRAAEEADDPVRIAAAHWNLGHVLLGDDRPDDAEHVARQGLSQLKECPGNQDSKAMQGALELVVVLSRTHRREWWPAREHLEKSAAPLADNAGEGNTMWTVFGPTNVKLHLLTIEMRAGETTEALRVADQVSTDVLPSRERRFTFTLDLARCYDLRREDTAVLLHLIDLEEMAPEDLARSPEAHAIAHRLVRRVRPTYRRQASSLAQRMGAL
ncbi:helix-turn-helix transcriptional regulator [Streptomyces sp. B6B3]|uniref:helix-turn-helix transcriptional regulator n=1 Tax=Streptomyces sp. B6B3 TaxID=3153570 RepID=UPI00325E6884